MSHKNFTLALDPGATNFTILVQAHLIESVRTIIACLTEEAKMSNFW